MAYHMPVQTPPNFISLVEAVSRPVGQFYNVIGICVDFLEPAQSGGTDQTTKITLSDPTWSQDRGMTFRYFHKKREGLPAVQNTGDIVILKNIATKRFGSSPIGLSHVSTTWTVLSGASVADSICSHGSDIQYTTSPDASSKAPTIPELQYAKILATRTNPSLFGSSTGATALQVEGIMKANGGVPPPRKEKLRLVKDLNLSKTDNRKFSDGQPAFADLIGEIRKIYTGDAICVEAYLTDYTMHKKLYDYSFGPTIRDGDDLGYITKSDQWPGPWGRMSIKVSLWDAHAAFARHHVKPGTFVSLRNCQIKYDKNDGQLEAACRGDRNDASKVNISVLEPREAATDDKFRQLLQRRRDYEKSAFDKGLPPMAPLSYLDRKRPLASFVGSIDEAATEQKPAKVSKSKRRKQSRAKQEAAKAATDAGEMGLNLHNHRSTTTINPNVRCEKIDIPLTSIRTILDPSTLRRSSLAGNEYSLPFQNCVYRSMVRVVDCWPNDMSDFAVPSQMDVDEKVTDADAADESMDLATVQTQPELIRWEWRFALVVEDASSPADDDQAPVRAPLLVTARSGEYLLKEDACDLKQDPDLLAKVREKLFLLWGDLYEQKAEAGTRAAFEQANISSKPFECLIQEYGLPITDDVAGSTTYQRILEMKGVTM